MGKTIEEVEYFILVVETQHFASRERMRGKNAATE